MNKKDKTRLAITAVLVVVFILALGNAKKTISRVQARRKKTLKSTVLTKSEDSNIPYDVLYPSQGERQSTEGLYKSLEEETRGIVFKRDPLVGMRLLLGISPVVRWLSLVSSGTNKTPKP